MTESVYEPRFLWTHLKMKPVYWRVAAGSQSGRMGLFSPVAKFELKKEEIAERNLAAESPPVTEPETKPEVSPQPVPPAEKKEKPPLPDKSLEPGFLFA